jgi:CRP/FNR family transcriptional regulator, anaerobic regulatory protein
MQILDLDAADHAWFEEACGFRLQFDKQMVIREQGEEVKSIYLLASGWVSSSIILPDGERQIVGLHLPGDLLGVPSTVLASSAESLTALTAVEAYRISMADFFSFFKRQPRLAVAVFLQDQQDDLALIDRLTAVARLSATHRMIAFLLHIHDRLARIRSGPVVSFELPLTQVDLADALGITHVHLNRVIKDLKAAGLIDYARNRVTLKDLARLRTFSSLPSGPHPLNVFKPRWLRSADNHD